MAIEDILSALEQQAQTDIDAVLAEAQEHAKLIVEQAEEEAGRVRDGFVVQVERAAAAEAAKLVNAARLEGKMAVSAARGKALESAFEGARTQLRGIRGGGDYDGLFSALANEALDGVEGRAVLHVDPADETRARSMASDADVIADIDTAGGVVVEANGGRIVRRNTLESRLDRAAQVVQADVARVLFE